MAYMYCNISDFLLCYWEHLQVQRSAEDVRYVATLHAPCLVVGAELDQVAPQDPNQLLGGGVKTHPGGRGGRSFSPLVSD